MKKQLWVLLLALVLAVSLIACVACKPDPATYKLTYAAGEGSGTAPAVESLAEGAEITLKAANTFTAPDGKEFDGWLVDGVKKAAGDKITMPAKDLTITAQWKTTQPVEPTKYTVTYVANGGTGTAPAVESVAAGTEITLKAADTFTAPAGKEFNGWLVSGEQTARQAGAKLNMPANNITITAQWKNAAPETCTITFKVGSNTAGVRQVEKGGKLPADQFPPYTPDAGKVFVGWFDDEDNKVDENTVINSDITVTAKVENAQPALTPEAFIGIFDLLDENEIDWLLTITAKADAVEGEVPLSVTVDEDDATDIELTVVGGKQQLSFSVTMGLGSATVYTMTLESDGSFTLVDNDDMAYTVTKRGDDPNPSRPSIDDYQGIWIGSISFNGDYYDQFRIVGNKINLRDEYYGEYYDSDDKTLTVVSNEEQLVVSFGVTGGNGYTATLTFTSDTTCTLSITTTGTLSKTVTANFVKAVYVTVSFNMGEGYQGTPETIADKQVVAQLTTSAPATPKWVGYKFLGWFAPEATEAFDFANTPITENITLTAHWEQITEVKVTFALQAGVTGIEVPAAQTVAFNTVVTEPNAETFAREGFRFDGWFNGNVKFDFATPVTENITLTAKWTQLVTVTYVYPKFVTATAPEASTVAKGTSITLPACPEEVEGKSFFGWTISAIKAGTIRAADTEYTANENITITAIYGTAYSINNSGATEEMKLRSDGKVSIGYGVYESYAEKVFSSTRSIISIYDEGYLSLAVSVDINAKTGITCQDSLWAFSFTANDGTTVLKFDGAGNLLLGELAGTYTWNDDYSAIKIIIAGQQATLNLAVKDNAFVIDGYFEITVNETKYQFGEEPVEYTVNFELGGGTGTAPAAIKVMSNVGEITLPNIGADVANGELVFKGWAVKDLATTDPAYEVYAAGAKIEVSADATLVAVWGEAGDDPVVDGSDTWDIDADGMITIKEGKTLSGEVTVPSIVNGQKVVGIKGGSSGSASVSPFKANSDVTKVIISEGITTIDANVFYFTSNDTSNITEIVLPSTLKTIGKNAFYNCKSLTTINLPTGLTSIGSQAFYNCVKLGIDVVIPAGVTTIESGVFSGCAAIKSIQLHSNITSIGGTAFSGCTSVSGTITISSVLTTLGGSAFKGITNADFVITADLTAMETTKVVTATVFDTSAKIYVSDELYDAFIASSTWSSNYSERLSKLSEKTSA